MGIRTDKMNKEITCPKCNHKVAEQEIVPDQTIRFYCEPCKKEFWVVSYLKIKKLVEFKEE